MTVERKHDGAILISEMVFGWNREQGHLCIGDFLFQFRYYDYTVEEAKERFKNELKKEGLRVIG